MANEVKIGSSLQVDKGNFASGKLGGSFQVDQNGTGGSVPGQISATTAAQGVIVDLSALTVLGYVYLQNLDATNFVEWGPTVAAVFHPIGKMKPGEQAGPFRLSPGKSLTVKADTAAALVQVQAFED